MPTVQVRQSGTAPLKRAAIDGVQLNWQQGTDSVAKNLPSGNHVLQWYAEGAGTYRFRFLQPPGIPCVPNGTLTAGQKDWGECPFVL